MGRPYSEDLRSRIVAAVEAGMSRNAAARQFAVSVSCVSDTPAPRSRERLGKAGRYMSTERGPIVVSDARMR